MIVVGVGSLMVADVGGIMRHWVVVVKEVDGGFEGDIEGLGGAFGVTMFELMDRLRWMMVESEENGRPQ
jgi:hypothetical protein